MRLLSTLLAETVCFILVPAFACYCFICGCWVLGRAVVSLF